MVVMRTHKHRAGLRSLSVKHKRRVCEAVGEYSEGTGDHARTGSLREPYDFCRTLGRLGESVACIQDSETLRPITNQRRTVQLDFGPVGLCVGDLRRIRRQREHSRTRDVYAQGRISQGVLTTRLSAYPFCQQSG